MSNAASDFIVPQSRSSEANYDGDYVLDERSIHTVFTPIFYGISINRCSKPRLSCSFFTHLICNSVCEARPHIKVLVDSTRKRHAVSSAWKLPMSCTHQSLNPVFSWIDWHSGSYTLANPEKNCEVSGCETDISQPYNYPQSPLWVTLIGEAIEI